MKREKLLKLCWILLFSSYATGLLSSKASGAEHRISPLQPPYLLYLPMVMVKSSSSSQEIANPGFEQGDSGWIFYSNQDYCDAITPIRAHSGTYSASLGNGHNNCIASISQNIQVPATRSKLTFWIYIESNDVCGSYVHYDYLTFLINGQEHLLYDICANNSTYQWVPWDLNLSSFTGQTVFFDIEFRSDGSIDSYVYLDEFQFVSP